jgi:hypothetical protein
MVEVIWWVGEAVERVELREMRNWVDVEVVGCDGSVVGRLFSRGLEISRASHGPASESFKLEPRNRDSTLTRSQKIVDAVFPQAKTQCGSQSSACKCGFDWYIEH